MKRVPKRTCVGCLTVKPKSKLMRLVVKKGEVVADSTGKARGRGAYLCRRGRGINKSCLKLAKEKDAFKKAFGKKINQTRLDSKARQVSSSGSLRPY